MTRDEAHAVLRRLKHLKANYNMRIGLARGAGDKITEHRLIYARSALSQVRKAFLQKEGKGL
jgi:methyl coenzyme M reductase subunit C-like uncharacterized protein (methanogenesis marker protein 7)